MLAPRDQLTRWNQLLQQPGNPVPLDGKTIAAELDDARGQHRNWIVACVKAVAAIDQGTHLPITATLPEWPKERRPAAQGAQVANDVWQAYLAYRLGHEDAEDWLKTMICSLAPMALVFTADDNPEPWWQNEMVILHALHSFALRYDVPAVLNRTLACSDYHLREIQPDHATNEPWAVHAYGSHIDGNVTAETLLHAGYIQHGGVLGPIARAICTDAASSLAAYLKA